MSSHSEYRIYNTPFYIGWQLHLILKNTEILYQTDTSWRRIVFRIRATREDHTMISNFIRSLSNESRRIRVKPEEISSFIKELEVWGIEYKDIVSKGRWNIVRVYGPKDLIEMFENYYNKSLSLPPVEPLGPQPDTVS